MEEHLIFLKEQYFQNGQHWPPCKGYSLCKTVTLGQKLKISKTCQKKCRVTLEFFLCKTPLQKTPNIRKMVTFSKWPKLATMRRLYPLKNRLFGSKIKIVATTCQNISTTTLELFCAKSCSKKHLILKKRQYFQNGQNWPPCKGYSLCKIVTLSQKLKLSKTSEKHLYNHIRLVPCKNPFQKARNIRKMTTFPKWPKLATMQRL